MQLYDEAYEKGMDKPRLLRGYSVLLIRTGHFDKALEVLKKIEALPGLYTCGKDGSACQLRHHSLAERASGPRNGNFGRRIPPF